MAALPPALSPARIGQQDDGGVATRQRAVSCSAHGGVAGISISGAGFGHMVWCGRIGALGIMSMAATGFLARK